MQHGRAAIQAALDKVTVSADHVNTMLRQVQDSVESAKVFERFKACGAVLPNNPNRKLVSEIETLSRSFCKLRPSSCH